MTSTFQWNTGEPSLMCTESEIKKAAQHAKIVGRVLDSAGRATVNLAPMRSSISLSKLPQADADKTAKIRRGAM